MSKGNHRETRQHHSQTSRENAADGNKGYPKSCRSLDSHFGLSNVAMRTYASNQQKQVGLGIPLASRLVARYILLSATRYANLFGNQVAS